MRRFAGSMGARRGESMSLMIRDFLIPKSFGDQNPTRSNGLPGMCLPCNRMENRTSHSRSGRYETNVTPLPQSSTVKSTVGSPSVSTTRASSPKVRLRPRWSKVCIAKNACCPTHACARPAPAAVTHDGRDPLHAQYKRIQAQKHHVRSHRRDWVDERRGCKDFLELQSRLHSACIVTARLHQRQLVQI